MLSQPFHLSRKTDAGVFWWFTDANAAICRSAATATDVGSRGRRAPPTRSTSCHSACRLLEQEDSGGGQPQSDNRQPRCIVITAIEQSREGPFRRFSTPHIGVRRGQGSCTGSCPSCLRCMRTLPAHPTREDCPWAQSSLLSHARLASGQEIPRPDSVDF